MHNVTVICSITCYARIVWCCKMDYASIARCGIMHYVSIVWTTCDFTTVACPFGVHFCALFLLDIIYILIDVFNNAGGSLSKQKEYCL